MYTNLHTAEAERYLFGLDWSAAVPLFTTDLHWKIVWRCRALPLNESTVGFCSEKTT